MFTSTRRTLTPLALTLACGLALTSPLFARAEGTSILQAASQPPVLAGKSNAALQYYQSWQSIEDTERRELFAHEASDELLIKHQSFVQSLLRAAETKDCDWGLRYEEGWDLLLPQLGLMRGTARMFKSDALRLLEQPGDDNQREAVRRIAALYPLSMHLRNDRILISSLVAQAIASLGNSIVTDVLRNQQLSVSNAQSILNAMRVMPEEDRFGTDASIRGEQVLSVDWIRSRFKGALAGNEFIGKMAGSFNPTSSIANTVAAMKEEDLGKELDKAAIMYDELVKAWSAENAADALDAVENRVNAGEYGLLATLMAPSLKLARTATTKINNETNHTIKMLAGYISNNGTLPEEFLPKPDPETPKSSESSGNK